MTMESAEGGKSFSGKETIAAGLETGGPTRPGLLHQCEGLREGLGEKGKTGRICPGRKPS